MITAVVVDDHEPYRRALVRVLAASGRFSVGLSCTGAREALEWLGSNTAMLVVCDLHLGAMDGEMLCRELRRRRSPVPVCLLSADSRRSALVSALGAGAGGFVHKSAPARELVGVLERVAAGKVAVDSQSALSLVARTSGSVGVELDSAQLAWLKGLADGVPLVELAAGMGIPVGELDTLRDRTLAQLAASHEASAVGWALRNKVIE